MKNTPMRDKLISIGAAVASGVLLVNGYYGSELYYFAAASALGTSYFALEGTLFE